MLRLQRNVPSPVRGPVRDKRKKYPFERWQVGEFLFVPNKKTNSIRSYFSTAGKQHGIKLTSKLTYARRDENEQWEECPFDTPGAVMGVGVWRIE